MSKEQGCSSKQDNEQTLTQGDGDNEISEQEELEWLVQLDLIFNLWDSFSKKYQIDNVQGKIEANLDF